MSQATPLIDGALRAKDSLLIYGANLRTAELLGILQERVGSFEVVDVRDPAQTPDERAFRRLIADRLGTSLHTVVVLTGAKVPAHVRAVLSEVVEGQLVVEPGDIRQLQSSRVVAMSPDDAPEEAFASLFALRIPAARAIA